MDTKTNYGDMAARAEHRESSNQASFFVPSQVLFYLCMVFPYAVISVLLFWKFQVVSVILLITVVPALVNWFYKNFRLGFRDATDVNVGPPIKQNCAVIGSGVSGIVAMKELKAQGHKVTCFEKLDDIGGIFYYQPDRGGVWDSAHLTSSPYVTAFSDFPPQEVNHAHWHHAEYCEYLRSYCKKFNLLSHIEFKTTVKDIVQRDDGKWSLTSVCNGKETTRTFDAVQIGSGLNQELNVPPYAKEDQTIYKGKIMHSAYYKTTEEFKGKRVLVIGIGETGADLVREISGVTETCALSVRRGTFVIPRVNPHTLLNNDYDTNRLRYSAPIFIRDSLIWLRETLSYYLGSMSPQGEIMFKLYRSSKAGAMSQFACKSDRFIKCLAEKSCELKPAVKHLTATGAVFNDGTSYDADIILLCTGFRGKVNFLTLPEGVPCMSKMYKKSFIPEVGPSLSFIGFARPSIGAIPPIAELQARWIALVLSGRRNLPPLEEMYDIIEHDNANHNFSQDVARPTLVNWIHFMDQVADLIGCRPKPATLFKDPFFMWKVMTGPMTCNQYRIDGPDACPALVRKVITSLPRGMPIIDLAIWTCYNCTAAVLSTFGVPGLNQWSTII